MKKNIYLIQPNDVLSDSIFLPYTIAAIASYSWQFDHIKNEYELRNLIFKKDDIDDTVAHLDTPFLVGFSTYMWNVKYNLALSKKIKEKWPECIIVFGGPQIPDDSGFLEKYDYIDILIFGEGEYAFYSLLTSLISSPANLSSVNNICYRLNGKIEQTEREYSDRLNEYPSPYASGVLDFIVNDPENFKYDFQAVLETNRGCPYSCIYCTWAGTKKQFRSFPLERVKQDLLWIAEHKINYCICADSNFGILKRDESIADYIVDLKNKFGYPKKFETTSAKDKNKFVFKINSLFQKAELNCGISIAVQSFSSSVLEKIRRYNLSPDDYSRQLKMYTDAGIDTYTDFILALPGETYDSFCDGIFETIERGQHKSINVHPCEMLPNTVLYDKETIEKYDIKTIQSVISQKHSPYKENDVFGTRSEVVVSTNTMTKFDWVKAMRISTCIQSFHSFGLLKYLSVFLRKFYGLSYKDFYLNLYNWIENESLVIKNILDKVCHTVDLFIDGKSNLFFYDERFSDSVLYFKEGLFLCSVYEFDAFYDEIKKYITPYFDDIKILDSLFLFQKSVIKLPGAKELEVRFDYDWWSFFKNFDSVDDVDLIKEKTLILFEECRESDWHDYTINNIWYGKRENKMLRKYKKV